MTNDKLEHVQCNLCGADEPVEIYPSQRSNADELSADEFRSSGDEPLEDPLVKCGHCGFQYVTPRLKESVVISGYTNAVDETFVSQVKGREITFKRCLGEIEKAWKGEPGKIFDVGTANGSFLKVAHDAGWDVTGCEPSRWMGEWCRDNYGIHVNQGTLFDRAYEDASFDVITLWDVLEHTPDPMATLKECYRLLKPGGMLVVNYPDIGSWAAWLMGRKWVFLLAVHYYYFTRTTIKQALRNALFEVLKVKPHIQRLEFGYILNRAIPYIGGAGRMAKTVVSKLGMGKLQVPYWVGQTLVIARKGRG
jgi:2-polyprenyl-3-methyl-5-hydroxy-6-metoxy-1,4-benzoquinol methylase